MTDEEAWDSEFQRILKSEDSLKSGLDREDRKRLTDLLDEHGDSMHSRSLIVFNLRDAQANGQFSKCIESIWRHFSAESKADGLASV